MQLSFDTCYHAIKARDARFDGVFFTAVSSSGIFCRPICPAVTPKPHNCRFYPSAAAAMQAGFRPCLRCRPESAPHSPAWNGVKTTVTRALRLIDAGALQQQRVAELAARLGVGERHLRRLFARYVGASPLAVARSRQLLRAKQLLTDSEHSIGTIAAATGFGSLRQFNQAFHQLYARPPSQLRAHRRKKP